MLLWLFLMFVLIKRKKDGLTYVSIGLFIEIFEMALSLPII